MLMLVHQDANFYQGLVCRRNLGQAPHDSAPATPSAMPNICPEACTKSRVGNLQPKPMYARCCGGWMFMMVDWDDTSSAVVVAMIVHADDAACEITMLRA